MADYWIRSAKNSDLEHVETFSTKSQAIQFCEAECGVPHTLYYGTKPIARYTPFDKSGKFICKWSKPTSTKRLTKKSHKRTRSYGSKSRGYA